MIKNHFESIQLQNEALQVPNSQESSLCNENLDDSPMLLVNMAVLFHVANNFHL